MPVLACKWGQVRRSRARLLTASKEMGTGWPTPGTAFCQQAERAWMQILLQSLHRKAGTLSPDPGGPE